ncbi:hypothetical protein C8J57DRAFT_1612385 [Mycena rebaudengoi]|nr:hypothetical protein C8J57DRAFT_1612385 [Mycena rebaudengoi]
MYIPAQGTIFMAFEPARSSRFPHRRAFRHTPPPYFSAEALSVFPAFFQTVAGILARGIRGPGTSLVFSFCIFWATSPILCVYCSFRVSDIAHLGPSNRYLDLHTSRPSSALQLRHLRHTRPPLLSQIRTRRRSISPLRIAAPPTSPLSQR